jgi:hypothetical protein
MNLRAAEANIFKFFSSNKVQNKSLGASYQRMQSEGQTTRKIRGNFMNIVLDQNRIAQSVLNRTDRVFGDKIGIMGKIFGCWHKQLSRPFTNQKSSYRACLNCGAMKRFDTETLKTVGPFYYPPTISLEK